jgi:DNA mismatch repair protein MSH6
MTIVDRIFTRIGAFDKILDGKSTFYTEMEDITVILKYGTKNSLAIIDELGRGTSTFDGAAIAYSLLKFLTERIMCRCLFATHYHMILGDFIHRPNI